MPTKIHKTPSMIWTYVRSSRIPRTPKYNADEQTRLSWARVIESQAAVPESYKKFFERDLTNEGRFPYTVLTPPHNGYMHRTAEKLACILGCEIYILEKRENTFEAQCYPIAGISYLEARTVLLESSIKITGTLDKGMATSSTVYFNSVTDYLLTPIVSKIRNFNIDSIPGDLKPELGKFDHWAGSNFKFMNYARRSLIRGEKVIHSILQPEIRKDLVTILGKTYYKTISPSQAVILTNRELIIIQEEIRHSGEERYGGIWDYVPLNKITALSLQEMDGNLLVLSIQLTDDIHIESLFQTPARDDINKLIYQFKELTS